MGKVKDPRIWRAHSYFIFERKIHSFLFSGCCTETTRLHLAKGFLGLILNKSLQPYCQSVTNPETKPRASIQLPSQCTEQNLPILTWGKASTWVFAYRNPYQNPFVYLQEKAEECITNKEAQRKVCKMGRVCVGGVGLSSLGRQETLMEKGDCQMLGKLC